MRVNQILLVPEFYGTGKDGNVWGNHNQKDVVRGYLQTLQEHIEENRHDCSIFQEGDTILPNTLIICLSAGWGKAESRSRLNGHSVVYGDDNSLEFAELMAETLGEWAKNYVNYHHKMATPARESKNPFLSVKDTIGISVSPFKLNGPNSEDYVRWLPKLGQLMADCIYEYLLHRGERPRMANVNYR